MLDVTPFYAESGGQIADRGYLLADGVKVLVKDVQKHQTVKTCTKLLWKKVR